MADTDLPRLWVPKFQEWMTLGEQQYRKMLAQDAEILVRETPATAIEAWVIEHP